MNKNSAYGIFTAALKSVNPFDVLLDDVRLSDSTILIDNKETVKSSFDLDLFNRIFVVGCGKAAWPMTLSIEKILGSRLTSGLSVTKYGYVSNPYPSRVQIKEANHPFPDHNGYEATMDTIKILEMADCDDLIIALLSGGGSSLWALPVSGISLEELQYTTQKLIACGADITEINTVRKHISAISGGTAASIAFPATVIVFAISDVIGDSLDTIASGPFFPDKTSFWDAIEVLKKYDLYENIHASVRKHLDEGCAGLRPETPKQNSCCFKNVYHYIIASNKKAIHAAKICAEEFGYQTILIPEPISGESKIAASEFCRKIIKICENTVSKRICIIAGGETTVTLDKSSGKGGRNQEFALAAAFAISGMNGITILSCGTDGTDGPTDANGAIVDGNTISLCQNAGLDPLEALLNHDSYTLFNKTGNLIKTGPTFTNVMDLQIALVDR